MRSSIGAKIFSIALGVLVMMGAVSLLEWQLSQRIGHQLQEIMDDYVPAYAALARANVRSAEQSAALRGIFTEQLAGDTDLARLRELRETFERSGKAADDELAAARRMIAHRLGDRTPLDDAVGLARLDERLVQIGELHDQYRSQTAAMLADIEAGKRAAFDASLAGYFSLRATLNGKTDAARADMLTLMRGVTEATVAHQRRISELNLGLLAFASVLALALALWVTRGLVRPVSRLLGATRQVVAGILDRPPVPVTSSDEIGRLTEAFNRMVAELRLKERIKDTFGKYVDPRIVAGLIERPDLAKLEGERRVMTVSFCDMQGFTRLSEGMTPSGLLHVINVYLTRLSQAVREEGGVIDKYIGDAIMAWWGPPFTPDAEQASRAALAALAQLARFLEFERELPEITGLKRGLSPVSLRIGVATGEVVVGEIGSDLAKSYTLLGDAVNLASRLEAANKHYGTRILLSEKTALLAAAAIEAREIDSVVVLGQSEPQRIFELLGGKGALDGTAERLRANFAEALAAYRAGKWDEAERAFGACLGIEPADGPSRVMRERVARLRANPPAQWDGVWRLEEK
jgi:adenylate cyclase